MVKEILKNKERLQEQVRKSDRHLSEDEKQNLKRENERNIYKNVSKEDKQKRYRNERKMALQNFIFYHV